MMSEERIQCRLVPWRKIASLCRHLARAVLTSGLRPDLIVGIARGGWVPARILGDFLDVVETASLRVEHYRGTSKRPGARIVHPLKVDLKGRTVLLVDDVSDTGETLAAAIPHLTASGGPKTIRTAVVHHKTRSLFVPDYYAQEIYEQRWIIYPWAVMEDVCSLARDMQPRPTSMKTLARQLKKDHDVRLENEGLRDVWTQLQRGT